MTLLRCHLKRKPSAISNEQTPAPGVLPSLKYLPRNLRAAVLQSPTASLNHPRKGRPPRRSAQPPIPAQLGSAPPPRSQSQLESVQWGLWDLESAQLGSAQLGSLQLESAQLGSAQLGSAQPPLNPAQLESAQLESAQLGSLQLGSAQLGSAQTPQSPAQLESAQLESAQLGSVQLESVQLGSVQLGSAQLGRRNWVRRNPLGAQRNCHYLNATIATTSSFAVSFR